MTNRILILVALAGCGTDEPEPIRGPVELACIEMAEKWCCGLDGDELTACETFSKFASCTLVNSNAGCENGGLCVRSSVDFAACGAAIDALMPELCENAVNLETGQSPPPRGVVYPAECESDDCLSADDGCAEDLNEYEAE